MEFFKNTKIAKNAVVIINSVLAIKDDFAELICALMRGEVELAQEPYFVGKMLIVETV